MNISHITIDFWNTLFKSNPDYKVARNTFLRNHLEGTYTLEEIDTAYELTKNYVNKAEFKTGLTMPVVYKHHIFTKKLGQDYKLVDDAYFDGLEGVFFEHPPILVNDNLPTIIKDFSRHQSVSIISNTGMIPSSTLDELLKHTFMLGDDIIFASTFHSDQSRYCKPNKKFFREYTRSSGSTDKRQWLHIGDDLKRDGEPVLELGGRFFKITSPEDWDNLNTLIC